MSNAGVTANADGKKIVRAGTILGGGILADDTVLAVKATTTTGVSNAEGVLLNDTDVTSVRLQVLLFFMGSLIKIKSRLLLPLRKL
ncbi:hypothetical protein [Paenibacillus wynnii]|uniref:hypothetical protein n=1 Tax=Paenibacillus wynnii TaxID=268407 RepID=UPI000B275D24|nr:hypothetical protein [Paenibacillus wynnii]